jgi:uncharacterized membrane protein YGL010W
MSDTIRRLVVGVVLTSWLASLALPVIKTDEPWSNGWFVLVIGWLGPFVGYFDWLANPALLWLLFGLWTGKLDVKVAGILCVVLSIFVALNLSRTEIADNEGGVSRAITAWYLGFHLWLAAIGSGAILSGLAVFRPNLLGLRMPPKHYSKEQQ